LDIPLVQQAQFDPRVTESQPILSLRIDDPGDVFSVQTPCPHQDEADSRIIGERF
jgi:hypothetical protein